MCDYRTLEQRMKLRPLGKSGLSVAPLAFGGNVFGWTIDETRSFEVLDAFVDAGFNLIDTADVYSNWVTGNKGGESERIIGRWLKKTRRRDEVVIASKVGMEMSPEGKGLSAAHIERSVAQSLERLQSDRIDLYQSHVDDGTLPVDAPLRVYAKLLADGKIRAIGASNFTAERLAAALEASRTMGLPRYESLQPRYNLVDRAYYEGPLESVCKSADLGVLTSSSLASGFLSGKYRSTADIGKSPRGARMEGRLTGHGKGVLAALDLVSERLDVARSSVAIAWILSHPTITAPIASATSVEQLRELMEGATLDLDAESRKQLDAASQPAPT
jgi:aryl-alcohol dehydrogenase-like predicted oxidoreductase